MPSSRSRRSLTLAIAALGIAYPFLVYFGLRFISPIWMVAGLLVLLAFRFLFDRGGTRQRLMPVFAVAGVGVLALVVLSPLAGLKAYPILVSLGFAGLFAASLIRPPTIIERIARLREPDLPPSAIPYLRNVTLAWIAFFLLNATLSAATAFSGSMEAWTLYNGLISYFLIGAMFAAEFTIRWFLRRQQRNLA